MPAIGHRSRIVLYVGRRRIAFDIVCSATELDPEPNRKPSATPEPNPDIPPA
jgi:hypothetical protein